MQLIDSAEPARTGEELDASRLLPFLREAIPGLEGELEILQFPSGFSNLTYLVTCGDREMVIRRPPFGSKPKSGHDMKREFTILSALQDSFPYCPAPLLYSDDTSILGAPFFVMERLRGTIIRRSLPPGLEMSPPQIRALFDRLIDVFVELHSLDPDSVGLSEFGRAAGYVERQIEGWSRRFRRARTPDVPDFESVMAWLAEKMPAAGERGRVIHNDFRLDNVVLDPNDHSRIIGVLDWEMATIGDPLMDLGASLAYWIQADDPRELLSMRLMPTHLEGAPTRAEVVERYAERSGLDVGAFDFYYCYGLFRLAGIGQQIYYRFYNGQTRDPRMGIFGHATALLERAALGVIERSDL